MTQLKALAVLTPGVTSEMEKCRTISWPARFWTWATLCALLCGVFLRWASLGPMRVMLHHDEAWYAVDAMTLLRHPHLTPFLPNNFGRESGWVYYLIPYLLILGKTPFALRFAATTTGILTLAAIGRISLEMWGMREAFWNVAALAVFYWHVHLSHLALRANFYVLIGSLAAASLMHAYRVNHRRDWIVGGVLLGLLGYTYFASAGLIVYLGLIVFGIVVLSGRRRWGAALALVVAIVVLMPMGLYVLRHKDIFLVRPRSVIVDSAVWLLNARRWLGAWFGSGDPNHLLNLASRPILDALTGPWE